MQLTINNQKIDLKSSDLENAQVSFTLFSGRKFKVGAQNFSLNEVIQAVIKALDSNQDKRNLGGEWSKVFKNLTEKGYEKPQSESNFFVMFVAKVKHYFSKFERDNLMTQLNSRCENSNVSNVSNDVVLSLRSLQDQSEPLMSPKTEPFVSPELQEAGEEFINWLEGLTTQGDTREGLETVFKNEYSQAAEVENFKVLCENLPKIEVELHHYRFEGSNWGFNVGEILGQSEYVAFRPPTGFALRMQKEMEVSSWIPCKYDEKLVSVKVNEIHKHEIEDESIKSFLLRHLSQAKKTDGAHGESYHLLKALIYYAPLIKEEIGSREYANLQQLIPEYLEISERL